MIEVESFAGMLLHLAMLVGLTVAKLLKRQRVFVGFGHASLPL